MEEKDKGKQIEEESGYIPTGGLLEYVKSLKAEKPGNAIIKSEIVEEQSLGKRAEKLVEEPKKAILSLERPSRKSISPAKLEANRRNAKRSTGPRSQRGKKSSRRNSIKHGILSSVLLVPGEESPSEFRKLLCALREDLDPLGQLEGMLVEKIAICWWRLQRALRFERLAILHASDLLELRHEADFSPFRSALSSRCIQKPERRLDSDPFALPIDRELNKIQRYETSIHRQLAFAMNQLERLQRARKGDHIPPPVNLQVSSNE